MKVRYSMTLGFVVLSASLSAVDGASTPQRGRGATLSFLPEITNVVTHVGRTLEYYRHGSDPAWGAVNPNQVDVFAVMHPRNGAHPRAPLYVVLHSSGHSLQRCLDCMIPPANHHIYRPPDDFYGLFLDCKANERYDWWWGQSGLGLAETPVEKRVIATVKWTIEKYGLDPNRVYLAGNSMGGSGVLGIGLRHGDVFAAIKANVPAGVLHATERLGITGVPTNVMEKVAFDRAVAALPDPPVLIDYSAPNDRWSKGHETFFRDLAKRRYSVFAYWGDFGHANRDLGILKWNDIVHSLAWTNLVRNAAYPVFTDADCDAKLGFVFGQGPQGVPGQINGFFRWRNVADTAEKLALELRIATVAELKTKHFVPPTSATVRVAIRRIQNFCIAPGCLVGWSFGREKGEAIVDADGLLDLGRLTVSTEPKTLVIRRIRPAAAVDPAVFGFDPSAEPSVNAAALQRALDGGRRTVMVTKPGVYGLDRTVFIDSHTKLMFAKGVVLQKRAKYPSVLVNRGAYCYGHDEDIEVRGLEISVNGLQAIPRLDSPARNVRGHLSFFNAKNVRIYDFRCVDLANWQYCVHICSFENVLVDGFEIRGRKDGIHFNCGRGFVVRNGVLATCDDGVAVNAGDWPDCAPEIGDVADGVVENLVIEPTPPSESKKPGDMGLAIAGAWVDWYPGMKLQRNDIVRVGQHVYGIFPMPFSTNEYVSLTMPTNTCGAWKSPEDISFYHMQSNGALRAEVKNVVFRDIVCNHPRGMTAYWAVGYEWARCVRPELKPEEYPITEVTFERVRMTHPGTPVFSCTSPVNVTFRDCSVSNAPLAVFSPPLKHRQQGGEYFPGTRSTVSCTGCSFDGGNSVDFKLVGPTSVEMFLNGNRQTRNVKVLCKDGSKVSVTGDTQSEIHKVPLGK